MAIVLNATWGSTTANSYCTVDESIAYHESRFHTSDWLNPIIIPTRTKNTLLVWATSLLDRLFKWDGSKVSTAQSLACPRHGLCDIENWPIDMTSKPNWIYEATAEYSYRLFLEDLVASADKDVTSSGADDLAGYKEITVGPITLKSSIGESGSNSTNSAVNVIPLSVYTIIKPFGNMYNTGQRRLLR